LENIHLSTHLKEEALEDSAFRSLIQNQQVSYPSIIVVSNRNLAGTHVGVAFLGSSDIIYMFDNGYAKNNSYIGSLVGMTYSDLAPHLTRETCGAAEIVTFNERIFRLMVGQNYVIDCFEVSEEILQFTLAMIREKKWHWNAQYNCRAAALHILYSLWQESMELFQDARLKVYWSSVIGIVLLQNRIIMLCGLGKVSQKHFALLADIQIFSESVQKL